MATQTEIDETCTLPVASASGAQLRSLRPSIPADLFEHVLGTSHPTLRSGDRWGAFADGTEVIAACAMARVSETSCRAEVTVVPERRWLGIGRELVEIAIAQAARLGAQTVIGSHRAGAARAHGPWRGQEWAPQSPTPAAHPNSRFTAPLSQVPSIAPEWEDPAGVPISAVLFGGRRASVIPLVTEAFDWAHGVFLGSVMASETTAAAAGAVGELRRDPFAMLPFCGYHMGNYFAHWLTVGASAKDQTLLPKIFYVNWFRRDGDGAFLWPGYGENSRVLAWIFERCSGRGGAVETAIGRVPAPGALDAEGRDLPAERLGQLTAVDLDAWREEVVLIEEHYARFGDRLPDALDTQLRALEKRLADGPRAS